MITGNFIKGKNIRPCDPALASALDAVFGLGSNDKDKAAQVLAQVWPMVAIDAGDFDRIEIETEVTKYIDGQSQDFPATITILNLNLQAVLAGVVEVEAIMAQARKASEAQKALYKQSRSVEVHGYEAGKRGRKSSNPYGELLAKYG